MTKISQYTIITIPSTTKQAVIFPYDYKLKKFQSHHFISEMTHDKITSQQITKYLETIEDQILLLRPTALRWIKFLLDIILILLVCTALFMAQETAFNSVLTKKPPHNLIAVVAALAALEIARRLISCLCKYKEDKMLRDIMEKISNANLKNKKPFEEHDFEWSFPMNFPNWIELRVPEDIKTHQAKPESYFSEDNTSIGKVKYQNYMLDNETFSPKAGESPTHALIKHNIADLKADNVITVIEVNI